MSRRSDDEHRPIFSRFSVREDVDRELETHVRMRAEELEREGMDAVEAEQRARSLLGHRPSILRECVEIVRGHQRAVRRARSMEAMVQDVRYALRGMLRSPAFSIVAIITLALGIGANTAIFSVTHGVLMAPLPFPDADELVDVRETRQQGGTMSVAWPNFVDWHRDSGSFDQLFAYSGGATTVLGGDRPTTAIVTTTTIDLWAALGVTPLVGRLTTPDDHIEGAPPVVVVSESFWRNELSAQPLGEIVLELGGVRASVVGVVPSTFDFPVGTSVWGAAEVGGNSSSRSSHNWRVVGRLADGVALDRAVEEIDAMTKRLIASESDEASDFLAAGAAIRPLRDQIVASARSPLLILLGAAGLVLLVACTNLASTLLARGSMRQRELAVRASMGASRKRLVRQMVTESAVLATVGAASGVALARGLLTWLKRMSPDAVPRLAEVTISAPVLGYTIGLAVLTVGLFGLVPSLRLVRGDALEVLRGGRGNAVRHRGGVWTMLVGSEVALALMLLVGSGLLVRSLQTLLDEDLGFDVSDVMLAPITLSLVAYPEGGDHVRFYDRLLAELEAAPEVSTAGIISTVPLGGGPPNGRLELDNDVDKATIGEYVVVSSDLFDALDIPLVEGRTFDQYDDADRSHVVIVSESFARANWPGESALGHTVTGGGMDDFYELRTFAEVVGVVGDARLAAPGEAPRPTVYFPYTQRPFRIRYGPTVVVEASSGDPASVAGLLRATIERNEPNVPIELVTQESLLGESVSSEEFTMLLLGGFSVVALVLAIVGIYGVVSYSVARRMREMGIRLALGADAGGVLRLVMGSAMRMVGVGLVFGVGGAYLAGRVMRSLLYEVAPFDPVALIAGVSILAGSALFASWIPARAGTRVDPIVTMRAE